MKRTFTLQRKQLNVRVPASLREIIDAEIKRQGRKRDVVLERILRYFVSLKTSERDTICAKSALLFLAYSVGL
jgi:hypothetical protein